VLHDNDTLIEYTAEVALVESLGGVWEQPIGVLARLEDDTLQLSAMVATPDGTRILRDQYVTAVDDACLAGEEFAALLLDAGADALLGGRDPEVGSDVAGKLPGSGSTPKATSDELGEYFDFEEFADLTESDPDDEETL
jgi:hypothetical protein